MGGFRVLIGKRRGLIWGYKEEGKRKSSFYGSLSTVPKRSRRLTCPQYSTHNIFINQLHILNTLSTNIYRLSLFLVLLVLELLVRI